MSALDVAMARLKRANHHIEAAQALSDRSIQSGICEFTLEQNPKRRLLLVKVVRAGLFPPEYGILVGDAAHNLRSALDSLAFTIVKAPRSREKSVYFPICESRKAFDRVAPIQLPGVSGRMLAAFKRLQPYQRRKMPDAIHLAQLKALNDWDKHREIAVCCTGAVAARMSVAFYGFQEGPKLAGHSFRRLGRLKEGAVIASIQYEGTGESEVQVNPEIHVGPLFDKGMPSILQGVEPARVLIRAKGYIENVVIPELKRFL